MRSYLKLGLKIHLKSIKDIETVDYDFLYFYIKFHFTRKEIPFSFLLTASSIRVASI